MKIRRKRNSNENSFSPNSSQPSIMRSRSWGELQAKSTEDYSSQPEVMPSAKTIQAKSNYTLGAPGTAQEIDADKTAEIVTAKINAPETVRQQQEDEQLQLKPETQPLNGYLQRMARGETQYPEIQRNSEEKDEVQMKPLHGYLQRLARGDNHSPEIQRNTDEDTDEINLKPHPRMIQRADGEDGTLGPELSTTLNRAKQSGAESLDPGFRKKVEPEMGGNFQNAKIHRNEMSNQLNETLGSRGFAVENHVFLRQGEGNTNTRDGQEVMIHELRHLQQTGSVGELQQKPQENQVQQKEDSNSVSTPTPVSKQQTQPKMGMIQRKSKGGLEYTEDTGPTELHHLTGLRDALLSPYYYSGKQNLGEDGLSFFHINPNEEKEVGAAQMTNQDAQVLKQGHVKLENDVKSAEWIIEGHTEDGTDLKEMMAEIGLVFNLRAGLKNTYKQIQSQYPQEKIVFTPTSNISGEIASDAKDLSPEKGKKRKNTAAFMDDLLGDIGGVADENFMGQEEKKMEPDATFQNDNLLFAYPALADESKGTAQITFKYSNKETIKRINEVNISQYLEGGEIKDKVGYLGKQENAILNRNKPSNIAPEATAVGTDLEANSAPIEYQNETLLSAQDVGMIQMMILNDAVAAVVARFESNAGEARDKNMLAYLPKAKRQHYVHALAGRTVPRKAMGQLWRQLNTALPGIIDALMRRLDISRLSQVDMNNIASSIDDAKEEQEFLNLGAIVGQNRATPQEKQQFKEGVFGIDNALLHRKLIEVIDAYTESEGEDFHSLDDGTRSPVVRSFEFASVDSEQDPGAVYELRREIPMGENNLKDIKAALKQILKVT